MKRVDLAIGAGSISQANMLQNNMSTLQQPQAILFDWDNTLVDSWGTTHEAYNATLKHFDLEPVTLEFIRKRPQTSVRTSFPNIFGPQWQQAEKIYYENFHKIHLKRLTPLPGASELIDALATTSLYLAVVSNKVGDNLRLEAKHLGWDKFFKQLVGAQDTPEDKPAIAPVIKALEPAPLSLGKHIWFVGDSAIDMECAQNAGLTPIFIGTEEDARFHNTNTDQIMRMDNCQVFKQYLLDNILI